ncbi:MAG TPA: ABC transporter permease [Solirubrobacterales bacterium]|jgi:ABC-2 type transport system permease protein|nr:ABC transporter permease [Solirubrobacterales bacterium]
MTRLNSLAIPEEELSRRVAPDEARYDDELEVVHSTAFPRTGEWRHFWDLTVTLARNELKQRYFGSVLGYLWSLVRPLMLFSVLYFVFTHIIMRADIPHYGVYLLLSLVLWTYFAETTALGVESLVHRESIMRKINFPRIAVPVSLALTTGFQLVLNLLVVVVFMIATGVMPMWTWLLAVPLILLFLAFTIGVAMLLSTLYVKFRDVEPVWQVATQMLFWGSPVIYIALFPPESIRGIMAASPISATFTQLRHWVIDGSAPTAADVLGGPAYLLIPFAIAAIAFAVGVVVFARQAPRVAEEL